MQLINSQIQPKTFKEKTDARIARLAARLVGAVTAERQPHLPQQANLNAHGQHPFYRSTHYGIMIPDLPEPYRYLSFAAIVGYVGFPITDVQTGLSALGKADTASLVHGTALSTTEEAYQTFSIQQDLRFSQEPFSVSFGQQSSLSSSGDDYLLKTSRDDLTVELTLRPQQALTWFAHSALYRHFSQLIYYKGHITQQAKTVAVQGMGTLEHWNAVATSTLRQPWITQHVQLLVKVFTYQVVNLNAQEQILLVFIAYEQQPILTSAYYRNIQGQSLQYDGEIIFKVTKNFEQALTSPDGDQIFPPQNFYWQIHHQKQLVAEIFATVDTPYCFGLGAGYVTAYQWHGSYKNQKMTGRGYMEFIDRR